MWDKMDVNCFSRFRENMFSILLFFAYLLSSAFTHQSLNINQNDVLIETLHSAALQVISLHSNSFVDEIDESLAQSESLEDESLRSKRSAGPFSNIPQLDTSANFMHSYISDTGAGNREDLLIKNIGEERLQVNVPSPIRQWNYIRFNSTDFVMGIQDHYLHVWRTHLTRDIEDKGLNFDQRNAYCSVDMKSEGKIMSAMFFAKLIKYIEVLFFAVTVESPKGFQLLAYEVTYGECVSLMQLNLRHNRPLGISFVSSQYQSALVVLFNSNERTTELRYTQKNHDEHTKVIEVYVKDAIDMETFTINGFGFIAVANRFGCEVYRLSEFIEHHNRFDYINITGIIDMKAFRLGFNHFLGLATTTDYQYLYVWHSGLFYLKQVINVGSVIKWNTIYMPTCRDDVLIYLIRNDPKYPALIYQWNGQLRDFQLADDHINKKMSRDYQVLPYSLSEFSYNHTAYVLQMDTNGRPHLISIHTRLVVVQDPELLRGLKITDLMHKLRDRLNFQQMYLQKVSDSLKYAVRPNSNQMLGSLNLIRNLQSLNGVIAGQVKGLSSIVLQNSPLTINDLKYRVKDLENIMQNIEQGLGRVRASANDIVLKNRPAIITGHKRFVGPNEISSLNGSLSFIGTVGRQDLKYVLSNLYRISRPEVIKGVKHIVKPIYVKESISTSYTNGIDLTNQVVTTNRPQMITGRISYSSQLTLINDLIIQGKLNNLDLNNDIVFINTPDIVYAPKVFTSPLITAHNLNALTIDGVDLAKLFNNALLSSGPQTVNSKLTLVKPLTTNIIEVDGQVNGVDISAMVDQLVYKNRPVLVKGKKTFILDDFHVKNNLFVTNRLDGRIIPDDLLMNSRNQVITGPKVLKGIARFNGQVTVNGLIDGLRLPQDIVSLTKNDTIMGPIVFGQSIIANNHIDARQLVDGVDLSALKLHSLKLNDKIIRSNARFNKGVTVGAIHLNGSVNGINLDYLFREAVFKGSPSVDIHGAKRFTSHINIKELYVEQLNGFNISDFVSTTGNETIDGEKYFAGITTFNTINVNGLVSGVNISNVYHNRVSLSRPERITGTKNFQQITINQSLNIAKTLNGIIPQVDIVLKSRFQEIIGPKILRRNLNVANLKAGNGVLVKGKLDKILINDLNSRAVRLNAHKSLALDLILTNSNASIVQVQTNINGINISHFANNVMSVSKPQIVYSPKLLNNDQHFSHILSAKGMSGISLKSLNENAVHLNGNCRISGPLTFAHDILLEKALLIKGVINGVNLSYIASDAVYKRGPNSIRGHNLFKSGFRVDGNVNAINLNGVDLSTELLTNYRDHTIRGKVQFSNSLNISSNLLVNGLVNGIDLSELNRKLIKTNARNLIVGNLEITSPTKILSNLKIGGKLNGIDLNQFFNDALFFNGDQQIDGVKTMTGPVQFLKSLNTVAINDINIPLALREIVFIDSPIEQHVNSPKTFTNHITTNGLTQSNGLVNMGPINNVNLVNLNAQTIKINRPTSLQGIQYFNDSAIISSNLTRIVGRLNGIDLYNDVILLHINNKEPQVIKGRKTFEHLVLNQNAVINGLVNGFPLKSIHANTFYTSGDQRVVSHKKIKGLVQFYSGNNNVAILNGMKVQEELITLKDNQTIFAELMFSNPLIVNRNLMVKGLVSGVNLNKLVSESLVKDVPQLLSQPIKFDSMVFRQDVTVDEHVDNVDLSALSYNVNQFTRVVNISKDLMLLTVNRHSHVSDYLYKSMEKSVFEIDQFVLYQALDEVYGDHIETYPNGIFSLSEPTGMTSTIYTTKYNKKTEMFDSAMVIENSEFVDHKLFLLNGEEYVVHISSILSNNISSEVTRSGRLVGSLDYYVLSVDIVKIKENAVLLITLDVSGVVKIYLLEHLPNHQNAFKHITEYNVGPETAKVVPFLKDNSVYIVLTRNYRMNCMIDNTGILILALHNYNTFELVQQIPLLNIADAVHFENNGKHYLAFSDVTPAQESKSPQTIYIYRNVENTERCSFSLFQKLEMDNVKQLSAFSFGTIHYEQQYIAAANRSHVIIWKQEGESGFSTSWSLHTKSTRVMTPIVASDHLFIIVGQSYKCHESLIFKAETRGTALAPVIFRSKEA